MRITGGIYKGKRFQPPSGFNSRPTTDFARESLFNILSSAYDLTEMSVLDLFAGTGAVTYEFFSRGCKDITSVEQNPGNIAYIKKNLQALDAGDVFLRRYDVMRLLKKSSDKWDLIFADPPFKSSYYEDVLQIVFDKELLKPQGLLVLEHNRESDFSGHSAFKEQRSYGGVCFSFFHASD